MISKKQHQRGNTVFHDPFTLGLHLNEKVTAPKFYKQVSHQHLKLAEIPKPWTQIVSSSFGQLFPELSGTIL